MALTMKPVLSSTVSVPAETSHSSTMVTCYHCSVYQ